MGNYLTKGIKKVLKQYTLNFQEKQVSLDIMNSQFKIENLILNVVEINKKLLKSPFKLKFGVLKKFRLKLSVFGGKLENLDVDSLILILGPNNDDASEKFRGLEEEKMYMNCLKNMEKIKKGQKNLKLFNPDLIFSKENEQYKNLKTKKTENKKKEKKEESQGINFMGIEFFEIVKNFLGCNININNIHLIYEDQMSFSKSSSRKDNFILQAEFKQFCFKVDDIKKYTNKQGFFKNFFNIAAFLKNSGTWNSSDMAFWNTTFSSFKVSISIGNNLFMSNPHDPSNVRQDSMGDILRKFNSHLKQNRLENTFDLFAINKMTVDFIIFYKESSKVPIHGVFINFDLASVDFNLEIKKFDEILELLSYFNNFKMAIQFEMIKPKFRVLTSKEYQKMCSKLKLNLEQKKNLKKLNRWVIREYLMEVIYLHRYGKLQSERIKPEHAKILVLKDFVKNSNLYKIIFGENYPKYFNDYTHTELIGESDRAPKELRKKKKQNADEVMNNPTVKLLNKIHLHFRFKLNLKVNILNSKTHLPENVLQIKELYLDVFNPVANLKVKILLQLTKLILTADKNQYPTSQKKGKMGIFGNQRGNRTQYSSLMNFDDSNSILCFSNLKMNIDFTVKAGKDGKFVYIIYSDNVIGAFNYNYFPKIFRNLVGKLMTMKKIQENNFQTKFVKTVKQNFDKMGGKKNFVIKGGVSKMLKGQMFQKKLKRLEEKDFRRQNLKMNKYSRTAKRNMVDMKKSNIKFNFDKNAKTKLEKYKELKEKVDKLEEKNFKSQIGKSTKKKKKNPQEKMLNKLNKMLQNVVISLKIKSEPISIKIHDEDHRENLAFKYENQDIVVDIDLAFKEITSIKAFGLEIQSRESLYALKKLVESLQHNMEEMKTIHENALLQDNFDNSF